MQLSIAIVTSLLGVVFFDFRSRLIPVWLFVILGILVVVQGFVQLPAIVYIQYFVINAVVVVMLMTGVYVWFWLKEKCVHGVLDTYLGGGDLLFMVVTCLYMGPLVFIGFQVVSIVLVLLVFGIYMVVKTAPDYTIPLAGVQAIGLCAFEALKHTSLGNLQYRDDIVMDWVMKIVC
jgi:hypothetical protein